MNNKPQQLVSVIIAAYNGERYVSSTIASVIAQTYENIEIVIVNDGSTDGTLAILETYAEKDPRIVIVNQTNQGPSAARNAGFKVAKGDYFCIFDADDIMLPTKIAAQVDFMEQHTAADFIYSKVYYFIDGTDGIYRHDLATVSGPAVYKKLLQQGNFIYTSTVFFRRAVFDKFGGFDEQLRSAEEFDYWLSLARHGVMFLHQDEYLTLCRSRQDGLTSDSVTMYSTAVAVLEKHLAHARYPRWAKMTSRQYIKSRLLLAFSKARKQRSPAKSENTPAADTRSFSISHFVNTLFVLLRKIKFSLTFKKVHDADMQHYLTMVESPTL